MSIQPLDKPSWTYLEIEEPERFSEAVRVLLSALAEVCTLWWRRYFKRGSRA